MAYHDGVELAWDESKNVSNRRKHGLSFEQALELFRSGVDYLELFDADHSVYEDRFIAIGPISQGIIVVVWADTEAGAVGG